VVVNCLINQCSSLNKLKRLTAWILCFISLLKHRMRKENFYPSRTLSVAEFKAAEMALIKHIQQEHFSDILLTKDGVDLHRKLPCHFQRLQPVVIDNILRVRGCLNQASFDLNVRHPIILSQNLHLTKLVIRQRHLEVSHSGPSQTWACLR